MKKNIESISLKKFAHKLVLVKIQDAIEIRGFLVGSDNGRHGGLGNVFVNTRNGTALVRGETVLSISLEEMNK